MENIQCDKMTAWRKNCKDSLKWKGEIWLSKHALIYHQVGLRRRVLKSHHQNIPPYSFLALHGDLRGEIEKYQLFQYSM